MSTIPADTIDLDRMYAPPSEMIVKSVLILPPFHGHPYKRLTIAIGGGR
ncbi:MAG: hypothetical protein GAK35_03562 [Herbaspirillum frisingense]|uniref:Uncharacterized protein n=1 Tax=Herbaspirillum frisingense TaxID=92645 RepID=A0A7V8FUC0_9BURK|nr:MAG: hypothetical protein GAK35_03562 [Herbaspirillum frisingense]